MKIGDLVKAFKQFTMTGHKMGTIIVIHNEHYCNVLWVDGGREWIETRLLELVK
tara:strand:- start:691 stop:852 length:162 start_codon:yes stop_codon:yes gene_type:complete